MNSLKNPEQTTYFICREYKTFTITAYGSVEPHQTMNTGQPIVDTYLDKSEWEAKLLEGGIDLTTQEDEEII
jgi:hypothetical protein